MRKKRNSLRTMLSFLLCLTLLCAPLEALAAEEATWNAALGKQVAFTGTDMGTDDGNWNLAAVERGLAAGLLTDGTNDRFRFWVNAAENFYIGLWDTHVAGPYGFTLDLEEAHNLTKLDLYFLDCPGYTAFAPDYVTYSVSADGNSWTEAGTVEKAGAQAHPGQMEGDTDAATIYNYALDVSLAGIRYVKAEFPGVTGKSQNRMAAGEFEVWTNDSEGRPEPDPVPSEPTTPGRNRALGKTVTLSGYGTEVDSTSGDWSLAAVERGLAAGLLTDGVNDSWYFYANDSGLYYIGLWESYITGPYSFTLDLETAYDLVELDLYFLHCPGYSAFAPESVTYSVSADGTTWATAGTVNKADARTQEGTIAGDSDAAAIYDYALPVELTGIRYVRAEFPAATRVAAGEFEAWTDGTEPDPEPTIPSGPPAMSTNLALEKTVSLSGYGEELISSDEDWSIAAIEKGLSVLTDGVNNSPNFWANNGNPYVTFWDTYVTGPYSLTVDLGSACDLAYFSLYFYDYADYDGYAPDSVTFSVSADNAAWENVGTVVKANTSTEEVVNGSGDRPTIRNFSLAENVEGMRYVKAEFAGVTGHARNRVPVGEFEVYGYDYGSAELRDLALNRMNNSANYTYTIVGLGSGYDSTGTMHEDGTRYTVAELENESLSRLTDGVTVNGSAVHFSKGWESKKWNDMTSLRSKYVEFYRNVERIITLDLGALHNVTELNMHFGAVNGYGIYMPTDVTYCLSADGETYYEVAAVKADNAQADPNDANITVDDGETATNHLNFSTGDINYNARYVRVIFPVDVYLFADELYVWGYNQPSAEADSLDENPVYTAGGDVGHYATTGQSGGVKNDFMAYQGWYEYSDGSFGHTWKTVPEYLSAIAYVNENGVAQDWLFDEMVVMGHYNTSTGKKNSYSEGYSSSADYANQSDWGEWLNYAFGMDINGDPVDPDYVDGETIINLNALEEAARIAKETLNDPDYKVNVKLVVYPAVEFQSDWGYINGKHIDFSVAGAGSEAAALDNRLAAYQWYIERAVELWEQADFQHLELTGFYYYEETIRESTDPIAVEAVQGLTNLVHTARTPSTNTKAAFDTAQGGRMYIFQLPYYQAMGFWKWSTYGFDYSLMQPNYAFYDIYTVNQLYECGELCQNFGLGMQMEFGGVGNRGYAQKFEDYLLLGKEIGYQDSVLSWYMSTWGCYQTATNVSESRYLYDAIYKFVKGRDVSFDEEDAPLEPNVLYNLASKKIPAFEYQSILNNVLYWTAAEIESATDLLTDGVKDSPNWWVNASANYYIGLDKTCIEGPYSFTVDLEDSFLLSSLQAYFYDRPSWDVSVPESVSYAVSADGVTWTDAGTVEKADAETVTIDDERNPDAAKPVIYNYTLDLDWTSARYVRITFDGAAEVSRCGFGEFEVWGMTKDSDVSGDDPTPPTPTPPVNPDYPFTPSAPTTPSTPSAPKEPAKTPEEPGETGEPDTPALPSRPGLNSEPMPAFTDVQDGAWYQPAVRYAWEHSLMVGVSDDAFAPSDLASRAMIWTVLARMEGVDVSVKGTYWYTAAMSWAVASGITDGTAPNGNITREQLAVMLWRFAGSPASPGDRLGQFGDGGSVSSWAAQAMNWAVAVGLLQGDGGALNPNGMATRAEIAAILMRFCENVLG